MEALPLIIILVFGGLILTGAVFSWLGAKRRREEMVALANRWGWTYRAGNDRVLPTLYAGLKFLERGSNRYAFNVLSGTFRDRAACAFDYHYETHSTDSKGKRTTHHHHSSVIVLETDLPLKPLTIRPEGFFDRVGEFFGFDDIDFESNEFSRAFHVWSPDRAWAFDVIHQETMEFLLAAPRFNVELLGPRIFVYREACFTASEIQRAFDVAAGIIDRLPKYLLREWKGAT
jgi:hypothetical protein